MSNQNARFFFVLEVIKYITPSGDTGAPINHSNGVFSLGQFLLKSVDQGRQPCKNNDLAFCFFDRLQDGVKARAERQKDVLTFFIVGYAGSNLSEL